MKKVLITGIDGFIGYHLALKLNQMNYEIIGIDNLNDYYDVSLKLSREKELKKMGINNIHHIDLTDRDQVQSLFASEKPEYVVNLAAQAGVRYSLENPMAYIDSNIIGFLNLLETVKENPVKHFVYASSSSVYGGNKSVPFKTTDSVDHPVSLYAATKKSNELFAHTYSHLYNIPTTGLRFFTVYGPFGRPDMAYYSFTKNIIEGKIIKVFNNGLMERDFTYIDDIVDGIIKVLDYPPKNNESWEDNTDGIDTSWAPYSIYNLGNSNPVSLMEFIETLENIIGKKAKKEYLDMQNGDVVKTYADTLKTEKDLNFKPSTSLSTGLLKFVNWYRKYYEI